MSETTKISQSLAIDRVIAFLTFGFVIIGMVHTLPTLPGLDQWAREITDYPALAIRRFPFEYLNPIVFALMMTIVVFKHSFYIAFKDKGKLSGSLGLTFDIVFIIMVYMVAWTYLMEIEAVCIIDRITGERADLIAKALLAENGFGFVALAFGGIGIALVLRTIQRFIKRPTDPKDWLYRHVTGMLAGYIATVTAFLAVNLTFLPSLVVWLAPTVIGSAIITWLMVRLKTGKEGY